MKINSTKLYGLGLFALILGVVGVLVLFQAATLDSTKTRQVGGAVTSKRAGVCIPNEQRACGTCNTCSTPGRCVSKCAPDGNSWQCVSGGDLCS